MKTFAIAAILLAAVASAPAASAGPDCIQVYPWSEICDGDPPVRLDCIAMSPFWEICNGNVPGAAAWLLDQVLP